MCICKASEAKPSSAALPFGFRPSCPGPVYPRSLPDITSRALHFSLAQMCAHQPLHLPNANSQSTSYVVLGHAWICSGPILDTCISVRHPGLIGTPVDALALNPPGNLCEDEAGRVQSSAPRCTVQSTQKSRQRVDKVRCSGFTPSVASRKALPEPSSVLQFVLKPQLDPHIVFLPSSPSIEPSVFPLHASHARLVRASHLELRCLALAGYVEASAPLSLSHPRTYILAFPCDRQNTWTATGRNLPHLA